MPVNKTPESFTKLEFFIELESFKKLESFTELESFIELESFTELESFIKTTNGEDAAAARMKMLCTSKKTMGYLCLWG